MTAAFWDGFISKKLPKKYLLTNDLYSNISFELIFKDSNTCFFINYFKKSINFKICYFYK